MYGHTLCVYENCDKVVKWHDLKDCHALGLDHHGIEAENQSSWISRHTQNFFFTEAMV